jgi:hypothetical protein
LETKHFPVDVKWVLDFLCFVLGSLCLIQNGGVFNPEFRNDFFYIKKLFLLTACSARLAIGPYKRKKEFDQLTNIPLS